MGRVYQLTHSERRPYIPAGCDQQRRLHDGARAELLPFISGGAVWIIAVVSGAVLWAQVFSWLWLWF